MPYEFQKRFINCVSMMGYFLYVMSYIFCPAVCICISEVGYFFPRCLQKSVAYLLALSSFFYFVRFDV